MMIHKRIVQLWSCWLFVVIQQIHSSTIPSEKDFFKTNKSGRVFHDLNISAVKEKYFFWYPIILACSFERKNKNDPFSSEYIVPQLIMQWLRVYYETKKL